MHKLFEIPSITLFRSLSAVALAKADAFCAFLWLKNPFNQRNLRLINDLRSTKVYVRKNKLFMQNKANFQKVKLNVNEVLTKDYVQMDTWSIGKTKPIQSQFKANQSQYKPNTKPNKPNSWRQKMCCKLNLSLIRYLPQFSYICLRSRK